MGHLLQLHAIPTHTAYSMSSECRETKSVRSPRISKLRGSGCPYQWPMSKMKKGRVVMRPRSCQSRVAQANSGSRHMPPVQKIKEVEVMRARHPGDTCSTTTRRNNY
ncbi:hypothetical protein E2C01_093298 [Portunus trituberculatus]|uniref:Uncharacterized protein n=1 Tax=Portunus trituberculatus TaxID=210409 RepID=A0A5B7JPF1_PORTR|nr:hypothetical protein [Portunus trituberculatus]